MIASQIPPRKMGNELPVMPMAKMTMSSPGLSAHRGLSVFRTMFRTMMSVKGKITPKGILVRVTSMLWNTNRPAAAK